jgi:predicted peptidase
MRPALFLPVIALLPMTAFAGLNDVEVRQTRYTGGEYHDETFRYLLLRPKTIEPGKRYPLVLFLHGAGERGDDPELLKKHFLPAIASDEFRDKFPCFVVAPQCRPDRKWADIPWGTKVSSPIADEPTDQLKMALQCVGDVIHEFPVDSNRLYLTGISMGGYGGWDLAMRQPGRWAAVVPICGGGDESKGDRLVNVPVWAVHGDADPAVPVERSRNMIAAIRKAGGGPKYTELPGVAHDSWTQTYADPNGVFAWMFEQRLDKRPKGK